MCVCVCAYVCVCVCVRLQSGYELGRSHMQSCSRLVLYVIMYSQRTIIVTLEPLVQIHPFQSLEGSIIASFIAPGWHLSYSLVRDILQTLICR